MSVPTTLTGPRTYCWMRARFLPWDCDAELAGRPQNPKASESYELMLSATKARVPFTLGRGRKPSFKDPSRGSVTK